MEYAWVLVALWVGLAFIATLLAIWFKISTALTEIVGETVELGTTRGWGRFLAITGATVRTFLAVLTPKSFKYGWTGLRIEGECLLFFPMEEFAD